MLKEKITVGEAVTLINESILNFEDGLSTDTINKIIYAVNNEIQIRDYLLGIPNVFPIETCSEFLSYLSDSVDGAERYSLHTVLSAYFFEMGEMEAASVSLATALDTKSDYSLANLLTRVYEAGWSSDAFMRMRNEIHSSVVEHLKEMKDTLI